MNLYDVIIVGGGPAGMSAALVLARCRRNVLIFDKGNQRNRCAEAMHGYLTRDGITPDEFLETARNELKKYNVKVIAKEITVGKKNLEEDIFELEDEAGKKYCSRKLLFATGIRDKLPQIENFTKFYGKSIHHCPYCDGWESRDKKIVVIGKGTGGYTVAKNMLQWSHDISLCTNGAAKLNLSKKDELAEKNIPLNIKKIEKLEGEDAQVQKVIFEDGSSIDCEKIFFSTGFNAQCQLPLEMGCSTNKNNEVLVDRLQMSSINGLYVSGDAAHEMKLVIIAAGEGAKAAVAINISLTEEDDKVNQKLQDTAKKL